MKCSVYIATSVDGFIATKEGGVDWLHTAGKPGVDLGADADMGMGAYMASIDCMIMGRKCMEVIAGFNLSPEQWPYGETRIIVLSSTVQEAPKGMNVHAEMYSGSIPDLIAKLEAEGHKSAYIDGGKTIQSFLELKLINEMIITRAPILLGEGIPLFGTTKGIQLKNSQAKAYANDFIQEFYEVSYK